MNILKIEKKLNIICEKTHVSAYDFDFDLFFESSHPTFFETEEFCVARVGAIFDYEKKYSETLSMGLRLVNSPAEHQKASELSEWYPLIPELTPRSICVDEFPAVEEIEEIFGWPIFIKGSRQTSKHNPDASIASNAESYFSVIDKYKNDPILHWQKIAIREFVYLESVKGSVPGKINPSMEFRTFWWNGSCVGCGQYWYQISSYASNDIENGLEVAKIAAKKLNVPFIVIDIAKTKDGRWIVIECNDAQESGHVGIKPNVLWQNILKLL